MRQSLRKIYFLMSIASVVGLFTYIIFNFLSCAFSWGEECGMSAGPFYGEKIEVNLKDLIVEQKITIPNGEMVATNLKDARPPILIKTDGGGKVYWAVKMMGNDQIRMNSISEFTLVNDEYGKKLKFFNYSYSEPGIIYLDDNYNFMYVCLSPM